MIKKFLIGTFAVAALALALTVSAAYDFGTTTLRVGSKGAAVMSVQTLVGAKADGSFGPLTAAKVKVWQAANGLTADGVFGAKSKAVAMAGSTTGPVVQGSCPSGYVATTPVAPLFASCVAATPVQGSCPTGYVAITPAAPLFAACAASTTSPVVITTGGTEGYMSLQSAPVALTTSVGQSDVQDAIAAFAVKATNSDISVQRVNINLKSYTGSAVATSALPWKYFTSLSLYQDNTLLATLPVTSTSLTENNFGLDYTAVFSGFSATIAKNSTASFTVKADIVGTIPSLPSGLYYNVGLNDSNAVRGVDSVGLSQYTGSVSGAYVRNIGFTGTSNGIVKVVADGSNPIATNVVTSTTTTTTGLTALVFDLQNTSKYDETVKSITATLSSAQASTDSSKVSGYYLYDGATMVASLGNPGTTTLSFINLPSNLIVSANSTKVMSIKFDATMNAAGIVNATIPVGGVTAVDINSNLVTSTGAATGLDQTLQSTGVVVNLVSANATTVASTSGVSGYSTGTFVFTVKANGVNLAKLSTWHNLQATGTGITYNATQSAATYSYTVSPDTTVSDGSQVTVTLSSVTPKASVGLVNFTITDLKFMNTDSALVDVATGLSTFYTNSVYQN